MRWRDIPTWRLVHGPGLIVAPHFLDSGGTRQHAIVDAAKLGGTAPTRASAAGLWSDTTTPAVNL